MACLRRGAKISVPSVNDFAIDREKRIVRLKEHSAVLSKKEIALLFLLLEQPNRTLNKEDLCASLWPGLHADENKLAVLVRSLRRKTEFAQGHMGKIISIYGTGYRLDTGEDI